MYILRCFEKALRIIDPEFFIVMDCETNTYDIWKDCEFEMGKTRWREERMIDSFDKLNDEALTKLRHRKWLGRKFNVEEDPKRYHAWLKETTRIAMEKKHDLAMDMITRGWMKINDHNTKKTFI
jgi:hypothetical protein